MRNSLVAVVTLVAAWAPPSPRPPSPAMQPPRASARQAGSYVFSYFTNNGEDGLHLLASRDGREWSALNGGRSFLYPAVGSRLMRDPSITRGPDGTFHLVWTTGWWDTGIGIAHSKNLVDWSEQTFLPVMADTPDARNCWAPEIFFDEDTGRYLIFWATTTVREPDTAHRIYYVETRDFKTYTPAKILYDGGFSVIDAFIVKAPRPGSGPAGRYVMVMKDETALPTPKKHLRIAEATRADGPYGPASAPISVDWVEGPSILKQGRDWIMYYDEYTRRKYGALQSSDLKQWALVKDLNFPRGVRHGTAFAVPADVAARLAAHSTEAQGERWRMTPAGIEWPTAQIEAGLRPHDDHIEMSGLHVSVIVQYGVDRDFRLPSTMLGPGKADATSTGGGGRLMLWRRAVWPMLRTIPNNTGASLQQTTLRAWIATPLTVGIYARARGTTDALFSPRLWTKDGLATEAGKPDFWDRSTLYALRGVFAAGDTGRAMQRLSAYTHRRLLGEHVPYAVEAYPEGGQAHLSAEASSSIATVGLRCAFTLGTPTAVDIWRQQMAQKDKEFSRDDLIQALNEDLSREYQAVIAYVVYSQSIKGAQYMNIAGELEKHAGEELDHALTIAKHIDYLGGAPNATAKPVKLSDKATDMLRFDLDNENDTIRNYRARVRQCEALGEYAIAEDLREILRQEQEHQSDLAAALGEDVPDVSKLPAR